MARNGSGSYALPATMAPANTVSSSTTVNSIMDDIATALTDSINKDGTKAFAANQSMGGFKLTSVGTGTAAGDAANTGQVQAGRTNWADGGGTADAITASYTPVVTSVTDGDLFHVRAAAANATTTPTFTPNSGVVTARTIVKFGNQALAAGDIGGDGHELIFRYRSSDTKYELLNPKATAVSTASTTEILTGTDTAKAATSDAIAALWEQGSDIASAGTISVGEGGYFNVTGTTTITDIDFATDKAGRTVWLKFAGALTLTHNATTLILPTGQNIPTEAGDTACFVSEGGDNVRCLSYNRASGASIAAGGEAYLGSVATTSGTSKTLSGLTLTGYKKLLIYFAGVSTDDFSGTTIQVGNSSSDDVVMTGSFGSLSNLLHGVVTVDLVRGFFVGQTGPTNGTCIATGGSSPLTTSSTQIYFQPTSGTGNFDAGNIYVYGVA